MEISTHLFRVRVTFYASIVECLGVLPIVTVNDYESIVELFVKDGDTYADRFGIKAFNDLVRGGDYGIIGTSGK